MKRRLFFLERILYGDGNTPFNGVFVLKLRGIVETERLVGALERIQRKYALLRARVEKDAAGVPWFVVHSEVPPIPLRIADRRTNMDWIEESRRQWAEPFATWKGPLLRVVLLRGDQEPVGDEGSMVDQEPVADLIMAFHHCLCDGGSAMALMRDILFLLDEPGGDIGDAGDLVTMDELMPGTSLGKRIKVRSISRLIRAGLSAGALLTSSRGKGSIPRSADYLLHWKLDSELSAALFRYCKSAQVTVNTLLCVAAVYAFRYIRGRKAHQVVTCPVDIRRYHPAIKKDMLFAFGLAVTLSLKKRRSDSFAGLVQEAQQLMTGKLGKLNATEFLLTMEHSHAAVGAMIKVLTYGKPGNDLMFSNMGRLEIPESYSSFEVETIYSPTVIGPYRNPTTLVTTTYKGQLDFSLVSNRMVLSEDEGRAIRDTILGLLEEVAKPLKYSV